MQDPRREPEPRTVVITGASSGIGQATAEAFAREGARLVIAARDASALELVAERCRKLGAEAIAVPTDVTRPDEVAALARRALDFSGSVDIWVSNVGVGAVGAFHEVPLEAHEQVIRANLIGHINDAYAAIPIFLRQGHGIFVNMISLGGFAAAPFAAAYSASKFGLRGFAEALRGELAPYPRIHVCDVYPAFVDAPGIVHGANYTGRQLSAPPPLLDPRRVARVIVGLARRPRPTTMVGLPTAAVRLGHAISPELSTRLMAGFLRSYFARAPQAAPSSGNLFAPPADPGGIDGGLRSPDQRGAATVALAGLALAGGLALALGRPRRRLPRQGMGRGR
ncbi:SDR family oxidoreductase [Paracoccus salipaludis]|uniref:Short-chain dehydrogenase n=1 Tax=Paracoccus salipaludis TaxID=2032623 RepID=A0A2A2GHI2_9RHOB|nr:SDR family oxidoreductase [Paracoccus salipaludis]PAU96315.1 short-chain dehydrogenase [Paracoccus salipaludis]